MNNGVLILKNITREEPGILAELLIKNHIPFKVVDLNKNEKIPKTKDFDALIILGGPDSANDKSSKILEQLTCIKDVIDNNIPYMGICLGLQLLVKSLGGRVVQASKKEVGFKNPHGENYNISLTSEALKDPLFFGLANSFNVFQLHGESVELTESMSLLGYGKDCENQIVKVKNNAYGIQCHFELTQDLFAKLIKEDSELLELNRDLLLEDFNNIYKEYRATGVALFTNFLKIAEVL